MRFADMNWMDVENYIKADDRLMLVLGACEQHGYLSLETDTKIPLALADAASKITGIPVAPPLNFGCSPYFLTYPGTISLRLSTYLQVIEDILRSVHGYGFRKILILNGHGGNDPVGGQLVELVNQIVNLKLKWYAWWTEPAVVQVARQHNLLMAHANWEEAFPFTRVAELPEGEKTPHKDDHFLSAVETRQVHGDGVFGGHYRVSDAIMDEMFSAALADILRLLDF